MEAKRSIGRMCALFAVIPFLVCGIRPAVGTERADSGSLDGKVFLVEKGRMGGKADGKDTYIFLNGTFRSANFEKHFGFVEGAYSATQAGDAISFEADLSSESHGTIRWEGVVTGDKIDARYTWTGGEPAWYRRNPKTTDHWARSVTGWPSEDPGPPEGGTPSHLLDGKTFFVQTGEEGKDTHHDDYLVFRNGLFVSSDCVEALDFRESTYSATERGDEIRFRAQTTSPNHGVMIWDGIVRGKVIDATARWIHERWYWTIDRRYWFRGELVK